MISYTEANPQRFSFDMTSADRTQKSNAFKRKEKRKKKVGLQVFTTTPLSADTFLLFAQSINIHCFEN